MALERLVRQGRWVRREGLARAFEEKELHPVVAGRRAVARARWRVAQRSSGVAHPPARPVWLVGLQRSGTNMVVRVLRRAPEFAVHNESDHRAFRDYRLRDDATIARLIAAARAELVVFKPLCDSHRAPQLLELADGGRAVWLWRDVDGRSRSAVSRFGDSARRALSSLTAAPGATPVPWQVEGLSHDSIELVRRVDPERLSEPSAQALLWYVRNRLVFELGLHERTDVIVRRYDDLVRDPRTEIATILRFLGAEFRDHLVDGVEPRRSTSAPALDLHPLVRERCDDLTAQLLAVTHAR